MLNVSDVVNSPEFSQAFIITRQTGAFANEGEFATSDTAVNAYGSIQPASPEDKAQFLTEGERSTEMITIHCVDMLLLADGRITLSDLIVYNGANWRIVGLRPWKDFGYFKAWAVKLGGAL